MWISGLKGLILAPTETKQVEKKKKIIINVVGTLWVKDVMVLPFYIIRRQKQHIIGFRTYNTREACIINKDCLWQLNLCLLCKLCFCFLYVTHQNTPQSIKVSKAYHTCSAYQTLFNFGFLSSRRLVTLMNNIKGILIDKIQSPS